MNRRKSVSPLNESKTKINKNKYDEIMGIIVEKDECIENNNIKISELEGIVRTYGKREDGMK